MIPETCFSCNGEDFEDCDECCGTGVVNIRRYTDMELRQMYSLRKYTYEETKQMKEQGLIETGIVSEILVARMTSSKNDTLKYPIDVIVHVWERTTDGEINNYNVTVNTGKGAWVTAKGAIFEFISSVLPYQYQKMSQEDMQSCLKNIDSICSSQKITNFELTTNIGIFHD